MVVEDDFKVTESKKEDEPEPEPEPEPVVVEEPDNTVVVGRAKRTIRVPSRYLL